MEKKILIDGFETHFLITESGEVINSLTGKILKGTIRDGYRYYDLRYNNKKKSKSGHRLVAEAFIPNPNNYSYVHHKDNNKLNNQVENLAWVSPSENNLKENKKEKICNKGYQIQPDCTEKWVPFEESNYLISSFGRVKNKKTGLILKGRVKYSGYVEYCLTLDNKKISILAHRLVYKAFNPQEELLTINHKDGNKENNCLNNLENITQLENNMKSIYETQSKKLKTVGCYDKNGQLVKTYISCAEAARDIGCAPQSINSAVHNNYFSSNFYWKYIEKN